MVGLFSSSFILFILVDLFFFLLNYFSFIHCLTLKGFRIHMSKNFSINSILENNSSSSVPTAWLIRLRINYSEEREAVNQVGQGRRRRHNDVQKEPQPKTQRINYSEESATDDNLDIIVKEGHDILNEEVGSSEKFKCSRYVGTFILTDVGEYYPDDIINSIYEHSVGKVLEECKQRGQPPDYLLVNISSPLMENPINERVHNITQDCVKQLVRSFMVSFKRVLQL